MNESKAVSQLPPPITCPRTEGVSSGVSLAGLGVAGFIPALSLSDWKWRELQSLSVAWLVRRDQPSFPPSPSSAMNRSFCNIWAP